MNESTTSSSLVSAHCSIGPLLHELVLGSVSRANVKVNIMFSVLHC